MYGTQVADTPWTSSRIIYSVLALSHGGMPLLTKKKYIYKIDKHMYGSAKGSDTGQKQNIIEGKTVFKPVSDTFTSNVRIWDVDLHHKTKNSELT